MLDVGPVLVHWQGLYAAGDVLETDGHKVPDIDADIHAVARAAPVVMDVAKDLQRIAAGVVPCDHRVMAKRVRLVLGSAPYLCQMRDTGPGQSLCRFQIVVTNDEMLFRSRQLVEQLTQPVGVLRFRSVGKVANDLQRILGANHGPEVLHQNCIHVIGGPERPVAELDHVLMPEMRVCGVPIGHVFSPSPFAGGAATE